MKRLELGLVALFFLAALSNLPSTRGIGDGNFFQDKFCEVFCPKDESTPRLTLTDDQIETILNSDEILEMLKENPELLHGDMNLDMACLIEFTKDQRMSILAQFGGFFSSPEQVEVLREATSLGTFVPESFPDPEDEKLLEHLVKELQSDPDDSGKDSSESEIFHLNTNSDTFNSASSNGYYNSDSSSLNYNSDSSNWSYYRDTSSYSDSSSGSGSYQYNWRRRRRSGRHLLGKDARLMQNQDLRDKQQRLEEVLTRSPLRRPLTRRSVPVSKTRRREKRDSSYVEVCEADMTYDAVQLAFTVTGELVQLAQFPEVSLEQWFLQEKCLVNKSSFVPTVTCAKRSRFVNALVLHLDPDHDPPMTEAFIEIEQCGALLEATASAAVLPPTTSAPPPAPPATPAPPPAPPATPAPPPAPPATTPSPAAR